jgi:uroporphyrinogen decarboxylase
MNHRERALATLNHLEPDRVPLDLGSTRNTGILIEPYKALVNHLGLEVPINKNDDYGQSKIAQVANPDEAVLQYLDIDFRGIFLGKPDSSMERMLPDGSHQDELGVIRRRPPGSHYFDIVHHPFNRNITFSDIRNWNWPDPSDRGYTRGLKDRAVNIRKSLDCALVLHLQDIIVHPSQYMRGYERWYMDFVLEPDLICSLMDAILEFRMVLTERALQEVGNLIDVVSCSDDVADQRGPQISPKMYRKFIKPRHQQYFSLIRSLTSAKILYHSCGAVTKLIPDFIDLSIDFLNPIQVSADGMDTSWLKREYGKELGFWGAIDTSHVLPFENPEDVKVEVSERICDLAPGGGYVLAAVHNIQPNVPPQNIIAMYKAAHEFGSFPIKKIKENSRFGGIVHEL